MNLALCAAAAAGVQVGAAIVASRFALQEVQPLTLAMLRYAVGALVLLPFAVRALRGNPVRPLPRDLVAMAAPGIGQFGVLIALLNLGLQRLSTLLGWALLGESPGAATWLAMALVASDVWLDTRPADNPAP